jgi:cytochrome c556
VKSNWIAASLAALALCAAGMGHAQNAKPADVVRARIERFREIGTAFKTINDELKKPQPLKIMLTTSSSTIRSASREAQPMFPQGTDASAGVKTKAKAEIWSRRSEFDAKYARLLTEADKMNLATKSGDLNVMRAQAKALGAACQDCHRAFRAE